jgi:hypothetical protein
MPPKKAPGGAAGGEGVEGEDPAVLLQNYQKFCKLIGLPINPAVGKNLNDEEKFPIKQLVIDDEYGPLGPGGSRALMTAVMGSGPGMKGGPYKLLESLRIWRSNIGCDGAAAVAELLRLGGAEVKISYLELLDNNIADRGCLALGTSLSKGNNLSLLTLVLDYNMSVGNAGVINLCRGLRSNKTLRKLSLQYCGFDSGAASALSEVLANTVSGIETLTLSGNRLGGVGLGVICKVGLAVNRCCTAIALADNMIEQTEEDAEGLRALVEVILNPDNPLSSIDLLYNRIGKAGGEILLPALGPENEKTKQFLVDVTVPGPIFDKIFRSGGKGGKGKKGKGKKKKG